MKTTIFKRTALAAAAVIALASGLTACSGSNQTVTPKYVQVCVNKDHERVPASKCPTNTTSNSQSDDTFRWYYILLSQNRYVVPLYSTVYGGSYSLGSRSAAVEEDDSDYGDPVTDESDDGLGNEGSDVQGDDEESDNGDTYSNDDGYTDSDSDDGDDTSDNGGDDTSDNGDSGDSGYSDDGDDSDTGSFSDDGGDDG